VEFVLQRVVSIGCGRKSRNGARLSFPYTVAISYMPQRFRRGASGLSGIEGGVHGGRFI